MRIFLIAIIALIATVNARAQVESHVKWSYASKRTGPTEAVVLIKATIDKGWHIYSQNSKVGGPLKTTFMFNPSKNYTLIGKTIEPKPIVKYETAIKMNLSYFENSVVFLQRVKLSSPGLKTVTGKVEFLACAEKCLPPDEVAFAIPIGK